MVDIIVVGGGHAGVEAALAGAKMGLSTQLFTLDINRVAMMPCNPSIGGPAKGIVVREIEALGGQMGKTADKTALQYKLLNSSKGPGVQCLRVQSDKNEYSKAMKEELLNTPNLEVVCALVHSFIVEDNIMKGIILENGDKVYARKVILTSGTYMSSITMISSETKNSGPEGLPTTNGLSNALREMGIELFRLKTGTPARLQTSTIDFSKTTIQPGDSQPLTFSRYTKETDKITEQIPCYLTYTNPATHDLINANLVYSSMYSGVVTGVGARYCPSIEDKVVRFSDKNRHQLFLEPETKEFDTTYLQGLSTSLPKKVQEEMIKTIPGLEHAKILKYAYAIEYDALNPLQLHPRLEVKTIKNFYTAGQINGTSGYEEAAGQGLIAGINAGLSIKGEEPLILGRDEAYIGVMIDDLVTKGTTEPYRLLTSRSEYRLLLRHDNAYRRLNQKGYDSGLVPEDTYLDIQHMLQEVDELIELTKTTTIKDIDNYFSDHGYEHTQTISLYEATKRPRVALKDLLTLLGLDFTDEVIKQAEVEIKYEGYIKKAQKDANKLRQMEDVKIADSINYDAINHLATEARQRLKLIQPKTLGQASRISGVNPADIAILAMSLEQKRRDKKIP